MSEQNREALRREIEGGAPPPEAPTDAKEVVKVEPKFFRTRPHHDTCPGIRGRECTCAANLELINNGTYSPLEKVKVEWSEPTKLFEEVGADGRKFMRSGLKPMSAVLWRVDNGIDVDRERPHPSGSRTAKPIVVTEHLPPRYVCTTCGWAGRGASISHRCDKAAVALATRVVTLADGLSEQEKTNGGLRLVLWRDAEGTYRLAEELVRDGKVIKTVERDSDGAYGVIEGAVLSAVVDLWS